MIISLLISYVTLSLACIAGSLLGIRYVDGNLTRGDLAWVASIGFIPILNFLVVAAIVHEAWQKHERTHP